MSLTELQLDMEYSSHRHDIVEELFNPCLSNTQLYRRATGYFTSSGLSVAARGIAHLVHSGGRIQLITSPSLSEEDIESLKNGVSRKSVIKQSLERSLDDIEDEITRDRFNALAWLVSSNALELKLAIRTDENGNLKRGIFHEKTMIFSDALGNHVACSGSANETRGGLIENQETLDVFLSWSGDLDRIERKIERFEEYWSNTASGLEVLDFTDVTEELFGRFRQAKPPETDLSGFHVGSVYTRSPQKPAWLKLRDYQTEVIKNWLESQGKGIINLATGCGKTITALSLMLVLAKDKRVKTVVILCPTRVLVEQWYEEARSFRFDTIKVFGSSEKWTKELDNKLLRRHESDETLVIITTNQTFIGQRFQQRLSRLPVPSLIIADEVHNAGGNRISECLPAYIDWRVGLSATPERHLDDEGTEAIYDYFGQVLEPVVTLADALEMGVLTPYDYWPILVELTLSEKEEYLQLSDQIGQAYTGGALKDNIRLQTLLFKRARLIGSAEKKLDVIRELFSEKGALQDKTHTLIYCGDGSIENEDAENDKYNGQRQISAIRDILSTECEQKVGQYTQDTSDEDREILLAQLGAGSIDALVAIRCLDEGVDIPSVRNAVILASAATPRQFIQRRGRVLRKSEGKEFASIYDCIVIPPDEATDNAAERNLLRREFTRFAEFADTARNGGQARLKIIDLQRRFNLMDI